MTAAGEWLPLQRQTVEDALEQDCPDEQRPAPLVAGAIGRGLADAAAAHRAHDPDDLGPWDD